MKLTCKCRNQAARNLKINGAPACRRCYKSYKQLPEVIELEVQTKKKLKAKKEHARYVRKKVRKVIKPVGEFEFDTAEFREKQKTLPARQKYLKENATPAELHIKKLFENSVYEVVFSKRFYCL